jgi:hypothetical protein
MPLGITEIPSGVNPLRDALSRTAPSPYSLRPCGSHTGFYETRRIPVKPHSGPKRPLPLRLPGNLRVRVRSEPADMENRPAGRAGRAWPPISSARPVAACASLRSQTLHGIGRCRAGYLCQHQHIIARRSVRTSVSAPVGRLQDAAGILAPRPLRHPRDRNSRPDGPPGDCCPAGMVLHSRMSENLPRFLARTRPQFQPA